jgi:hypothetical protein
MSNTREYDLSNSGSYSGPKPDESPVEESRMSVLIRETNHEADVHIQNVWETDFGLKVGVVSKKKYAEIFSDELEWEDHHQKWDTKRTSGTDMWEVDLDSVFDVAMLFSARQADVTISPEVADAYVENVV